MSNSYIEPKSKKFVEFNPQKDMPNKDGFNDQFNSYLNIPGLNINTEVNKEMYIDIDNFLSRSALQNKEKHDYMRDYPFECSPTSDSRRYCAIGMKRKSLNPELDTTHYINAGLKSAGRGFSNPITTPFVIYPVPTRIDKGSFVSENIYGYQNPARNLEDTRLPFLMSNINRNYQNPKYIVMPNWGGVDTRNIGKYSKTQ